VHPCKVYNILAIGVPLLYVGPAESHVTDVVAELKDDFYAREALHGDAEGVVAHILAASLEPARNSAEARGLASRYSRERLLPRMAAEILFTTDSVAARARATSEA
jgi:hypothetical protein